MSEKISKKEVLKRVTGQTDRPLARPTHAVILDEEISFRTHVKKQRDFFAKVVVFLLILELLFLAFTMMAQGFGWWGFSLNDIVFGVFANGVLVQTVLMVRIMLRNLYPEGQDLTRRLLR